MAKYRLKKDHFLQAKKPGAKASDKDPWIKEPQLHEQGSVVEDYDGIPSLHMEPLDTEAKDRVDARVADFQARRAKARGKGGRVGWSPQFEANMEHIITRATDADAPALASAGSGRRSKKAA